MTRTASRRARRAAALLLLAPCAPAAVAGAQGVRLELRPRAGDTLHLRLDQEIEVSATQRKGNADSTVTMRRAVTVFSRSAVQRSDVHGATVLAITDSMVVREADGRTLRTGLAATRASLHVAPDGSTRVLAQGGMLSAEAATLMTQMPATLPAGPVEPGASWTQTAVVPIPGDRAGAARGRLTATFRLDSLSRYGDRAHVSMHGTLERPRAGTARGRAAYESAGTVVGAFVLDRRRGWLVALSATIDARSSVTPPGAGGRPMHVHTRVTQTIRALDAVDKE